MNVASDRVKSIFLQAIDRHSPEEWPAFLDQACAGDNELRAGVEKLLHAQQELGSYHEPAVPFAATFDKPSVECAGSTIGHYKLLQQIGEGGMGIVFMAEQIEPVRRKVAVKVIKPGMDSKQVIARFEAERQALAMMDHVNIARVLDAGATQSGRPYFVMELVHGVPITKYCDDNHLTPRERLELFVPVCHAIQHAHQKGVIHRDIKPSNIMVTLYDGRPVAKVIDFGVAKATEQRLTERTLFTQYGTMVGTLEYMSPEQAEMSALGVDTRSDIYSLGVVLYELLTGSTPLTHTWMKEAAYADILRMIKEEEPPKPSTRLSDSGEALASISANRHTEPAKLAKLVKGELDWIVMKTLEKDRNRRYETASAFAADVQRYLADEPVHACPPSAGYRLRKFARRNRVGVGIAALLAIMLLLAGSLGWLAYLGERRRGALAEKIRRADEVQRREQQAREIAIPQMERLIGEKRVVEAFRVGQQVREVLPDDPRRKELWEQSTAVATLQIEPPGTHVFIRDWNAGTNDWLEVGQAPLENARLPRGDLRWKLVHEGYVTEETQRAFPDIAAIHFRLFKKTDLSACMIAIPAAAKGNPLVSLNEDVGAFCIDRFEVSNREYQRFVDAGGYQNPEYWKHKFERDGETVSREEVLSAFCDQTGRPGPATWSSGHFPQGEDEFPVRGVSWYEAAAYAEYQGKSLPTVHHWWWAGHAKLEITVPLSNFSNRGPARVGSYPGIGFFGVYDMAGNVAEWCWNEGAPGKRNLRGGAWNEAVYMFTNNCADAPLSRAPTYGFRCVKYFEPPSAAALAPYQPYKRDYDQEPAATADELAAHLTHFAYDKQTPLHAQKRETDCQPAAEYQHDVVRIDAAYGSERFDIHLYLPRDRKPPYETVVWCPGLGAFQLSNFDGHSKLIESEIERAYIRTGRALCMPIYQGSYERKSISIAEIDLASVRGRTWFIQLAQDLSRTVDYLGTRADIDSEHLIYSGLSLGASLAPVLLVGEPRFQAAVLIAGGFAPEAFIAEIEPRRYAPHVKLPVLMIEGLLDELHPVEVSQLPMYRHLGSAEKQIKHFESGHIPPVEETIKFADEWLRSRSGTGRKASLRSDE